MASTYKRSKNRGNKYNSDESEDPLVSRRERMTTGKGMKKTTTTTTTIPKFHVLLTSYEMIRLDVHFLKGIHWKILVVDEGHRLKDNQSKLFQLLCRDFQGTSLPKSESSSNRNNNKLGEAHQDGEFRMRIILTGTPLQNNTSELFHLLTFLDPKNKKTMQALEHYFDDYIGNDNDDSNQMGDRLATKSEKLQQLHNLLRPYILRRLKSDVLKSLPPKVVYYHSISSTIYFQRQCR